jgi:hypothetical protein
LCQRFLFLNVVVIFFGDRLDDFNLGFSLLWLGCARRWRRSLFFLVREDNIDVLIDCVRCHDDRFRFGNQFDKSRRGRNRIKR